MARPKKNEAETKAEASEVKGYFNAAQKREDGLSQLSLAEEIDVSQGLIGQWFSGKTPIPDYRLIWLGGRLGFNPLAVRPGLAVLSVSAGRTKLAKAIAKIPPGAEDYYAECLEMILKGRELGQQSDLPPSQ